MIDPLRLLAQFHGHLGWLAAAALVHPAVLYRDPKRKAGLAAALACGLVSASALTGALVYGAYRERVKPLLFATSPAVAWMFERKEHLAFGAALFAWAGVFAALARSMRASQRAFTVAAVLAFASAALGTWVASVRSF